MTRRQGGKAARRRGGEAARRRRGGPPTGFGSPGPGVAKLPQLGCPLRQGLSLASSRPCASPPFWRVGARRQPDPRMGWAGSRVVVLLRRASRVAGWRGGPSGDLWSIACSVLRGARQRSRRLCGTIVTVHPKGAPPLVSGAPDGHELRARPASHALQPDPQASAGCLVDSARASRPSPASSLLRSG